MPNYGRTDNGRSNVLAWSTHTANMAPSVEEDAGADVDEPPDHTTPPTEACHSFRKTAVQPREHVESLLTRALQSKSDDEAVDSNPAGQMHMGERRRSMTSNTSLASTAGFTSDTGITTPARTNSPSPRMAGIDAAPMHTPQIECRKTTIGFATTPIGRPRQAECTPKPAAKEETATPAPARKRCISFACAAPKPSQATADVTANKAAPAPVAPTTTSPTKETAPQPRRPCIKFACPAKPSTEAHKPQPANLKVDGQEGRKLVRRPSPAPEPRSPSSVRKYRGSSSGRSPRSITPRSNMRAPVAPQSSVTAAHPKKFLSAGSQDLAAESSRFHEFASDMPLEEDWIRHAKSDGITRERRLTINDTLQKENAIRLLGKEAEEEAEQEEQDEDEDDEEDDEDGEEDDEDEDEEEEDDDEDEEDDEEDDEDVDENDTVEGDHDYQQIDHYEEFSDGYNTDNEIGFASSSDEDDGLVLWSVNHETQSRRREAYRDIDHSTFQLEQDGAPDLRRLSISDHSDSSVFPTGQPIRQSKPKNREIRNRPPTPELPDSTDFVCGTFDEDRPLEEAYLSHITARRKVKLHAIPQDIDPSFPTSDVEDGSDDEEPTVQKHRQHSHQGSGDEHLWQLEDLHHEQQERANNHRRKKGDSPKRYHSPPPPTKNRGRSPAPRRLFDRHSPGCRVKSPAPKATVPVPRVPCYASAHMPVVSPAALPVEVPGPGAGHYETLAFRPGLTTTKSLPRPAAVFCQQQNQMQLHQIQQQQRQQAAARQPQAHVHAHAPVKTGRRTKTSANASCKPMPMHIRGALDIVKGLERKRQRRKEKFQQKYCNRARKGHGAERKPVRGEGAERMKEIGLLMAGKTGQGNYVLSV